MEERLKADHSGLIINIILIIILVNLVLFLGFTFYQNYPRAAEALRISNYIGLPTVYNVSSEIVQFEKNMRFNHNNLSYFIKDCEERKISKLLEAFTIIEQRTQILKFIPSSIETDADILVGCSKDSYQTEENSFVAGEGGPTRFINLSLYPIILKGKIILYERSSCKEPITELHELLHVLGFDHVNDTKKIMYPYLSCDQELDPRIIEILKELYSIEPKSELYFSNASAIKRGIYLNFSVRISNEGLYEANNVMLKVYADNRELDNFELESIKIGESKEFIVGNLKLKSVNTKQIELRITSTDEEFTKDNNNIYLNV